MARKDKRRSTRAEGVHVDQQTRPAIAYVVTAAVLAALSTAGVAYAQEEQQQQPAAPSLLPAPGEIGSVPTTEPNAGAAPSPNQPGFVLTPSITIGETATDNALNTPTNRQADLVTTVTPRIFASEQSSRLQGVFNYAPTLIRYVDNTQEDTIYQNLLGNGTLTAIPQFLFLDANASISDQSRSGSLGYGNTSQIPSSDRTQQFAYGASPYARFQIDDTVESELRYRYYQTNFSGNTGAVTSTVTGQTLPGLSNATEQEGIASIGTLPNVSKLFVRATADYDDSSYSDPLLSSQHVLGNVDLRYPLTNAVSALASGGYESLTYPDESELNVVGPIWRFGGLYQVSDKQFVSLTYGRSEGQNSFAANARYAVTPVTSVYGSYSEYRSTAQQQTLQNLLTATPTAQGNTIDPTTGLPFAVTNPNIPLQDDIYYTKNLQLGASTGVGRNHLTFIADYIDQDSLLQLGPSERSTGGYFTWTHELSPRTNSNVLLGYSTVSPGASNIVTFSAGLAHAFGQGLQGGVQYELVSTNGAAVGSVLSNTLTFTLTKSF
jgi:uncharacterized protein (PEP-CTERM system associated)